MQHKYKPNNRLTQILLSHGLKKYSPITYDKRSKKLFRMSETSSIAVIFDYDNIRVERGSTGLDEKQELSIEELKYLLLFLILPNSDWQIIDSHGFKWSEMDERLGILRNELRQLKELDIMSHRTKKIESILMQYDSLLMES